jgi:hypothetical protein
MTGPYDRPDRVTAAPGADGMSFARVRSLAVVGALVLAAIIFVTVALIKDRQSGATVAQSCPNNAVMANIKLPQDESEVTLNVYNATDKPGLAGEVKTEFQNRKFKVAKSGNDPLKKAVKGAAILRYGPKAVGKAWLVRAYFLNEADREFDIKRTDDTVDVVLGPKYLQLATQTEVKQALSQLGNPVLPPGTCSG